MPSLLNLIEAHYILATFLVWTIIYEGFKTIRQLLRTLQLHPDYHTHNHITQQDDDEDDEDEGETEDEDEGETEAEFAASTSPKLTNPHLELDSSSKILTRVERVIHNIRSGNS